MVISDGSSEVTVVIVESLADILSEIAETKLNYYQLFCFPCRVWAYYYAGEGLAMLSIEHY